MTDAAFDPPAALEGDEVHVWCLRQGAPIAPGVHATCDALLSAAERARRDRFVFERHRHQFLLAHALVRATLSRYTGVDPARWTFVENEYGRPEIASPAVALPLRFNLSHTDGLMACAVTLARDVGVDVEEVTRRAAGLDIAERYFAAAETAALVAVPEPDRHRAFFDYWTLKEAYIKARGMGLALPLRAFAFHLAPSAAPAITFAPELDDDPAAWQFRLFQPTTTHRLALAVRESPGRRIRIAIDWADPATFGRHHR
ncbi:MAG TPA: 4'-phosphopantetheinyl transferase superfamily protein [Vicinamibacterales bacterium]|nr:4'-phosphopantetheinyl transferase superfamily protein [Vicinamibacterales bacterium]